MFAAPSGTGARNARPRAAAPRRPFVISAEPTTRGTRVMTSSASWTNEWMEMQQKYWQNWADASQRLFGQETTPAAAWGTAMDHWWKNLAPAAGSDMTRDFMDKMVEQGKFFFQMAEDFAGKLAGAGAQTDWSGALDNVTASLKDAFARLGAGDPSVHKMFAFWELPFDNWQRMTSSLSPMPGDVLRNMPTEGMRSKLDRVLGAPGLGYTREEQGQYQELTRAVLDYQETLAEYLGFFSKMGIGSVERLQWLVKEAEQKKKTIGSARELYDMWVQCCEAEYADRVMTDEYTELHGRLVNALMRVKQRMSYIVDEYLGAMNMPTRRELRTLQDRVQEARRETKRLRSELDALKRQMGSPAPTPAAKPVATAAPAKPAAAPRKKAATKARNGSR
jgi:class III poly(R)-hydroxyalkanoic acid synthase PhaE subunit